MKYVADTLFLGGELIACRLVLVVKPMLCLRAALLLKKSRADLVP